MSTTADLVAALKKELKAAHMTYADLAQALGMAESSVKRMLARGDMPLSRIDAICRALRLDFADLARRVADSQPCSTSSRWNRSARWWPTRSCCSWPSAC